MKTLLGLFLIATLWLTSAAEPTATKELRPFATAQPLALGEARWTSGFWAERFDLCRTNMLPGMGRLMEGTNYTQFFHNFEIAAGLAEGKYRGAPFNDGDFYKLIEAASASYATSPNDFFDRNLDRAITVIAQVQREDGYIHTPVLVAQRNGDTNAAPFKDRNNFEMYNLGHLMTAACVHHQATGKTNLLAVAIKAAEFLVTTFSNSSPEVARSSVCPSHYMGMVDLYRETGDRRYLELAKKFFELRSQIKDGGDDNQDRIPFERQTSAMGHAVRANYLYAGATDLFMETGDTNLWRPLEPIWHNLIEEKMYITGGCGALYDGASPDGSKDQKNITRVHQAYGRNYQLPNTTAHCETCANIGNVLWNWRMFLATGEARFIDVAELALYNSVLSGVSLNGTNFFYTNPLRVTDPLPTELRWSRQRVPFMSSFCCPPNLVRTIAESTEYAYAKSADAIWVNLYGASELETELPGVGKVKLAQETEYPWNGRVRIRVTETGGKEFALKLRIPGWAKSAAVRINHRPTQISSMPGSYYEMRGAWKAGDIIDLDLQMDTELIEANPLVEETLGQVAIKRGPIVYCLESVDLPRGVRPLDVNLPSDIKLRARYDQRLLGGVVVLEGTAFARTNANWSGQLYRELKTSKPAPIKLRLIPYSVWANRGLGEMSVWLPLARE
ncbi:MAG: glycoside hydrolase family 127 protein [Verrucomicrobia bacterium]|nr:MAG: glycoside hydrolase family 127 protein [Verrucomicrobiota bacterium]